MIVSEELMRFDTPNCNRLSIICSRKSDGQKENAAIKQFITLNESCVRVPDFNSFELER